MDISNVVCPAIEKIRCKITARAQSLHRNEQYHKLCNMYYIIINSESKRNIITSANISILTMLVTDAYYQLGEYEQCISHIKEAEAKGILPPMHIHSELMRGWINVKLSRWREAHDVATYWLKYADEHNMPLATALFLHLIGRAHYLSGRISQASRSLHDSDALFRYLKLQYQSAKVANALGAIEKTSGNLNRAIKYLDESERLMLGDGLVRKVQSVRINKAIVLYKIGRYAETLENVESIREKDDGHNQVWMLHSKIIKARAQIELGNISIATQTLHSILSIITKNHYCREEVLVIESLGDIAVVCNKLDDAERYYLRATQIATALGERSELVLGLIRRRGTLMYTLGDHSKAIEYFKQARTLAEKSKDVYEHGNTLLGLSRCYTVTGQHSVAYRYIRKAIDVFSSPSKNPEFALRHRSPEMMTGDTPTGGSAAKM
ncbi:tetratricopeptide repeat protein [bacterium]|nr:tetratricopeptide repeat protein [bacterium]MBU1072715.1 tetratricopeptide repeat protein [bacterium]